MSRWPSTGRPEPVTAYLAMINARIPRRFRSRRTALDELGDGLDDAITKYRAEGLSTDEAVQRAVSESGPPSMIADAFTDVLSAGHARRTVLTLLISGPLIGVTWLAAPASGRPSTMFLAQIPPLGPVIFAVIVIGVLTLLVTEAARLRPNLATPRPSRLAAYACACACVGDLLVLGTAVTIAVTTPSQLAGYPLIAAVALSLTRLLITQRVARRDLARGPLRQ